jgi:hypothetical protein
MAKTLNLNITQARERRPQVFRKPIIIAWLTLEPKMQESLGHVTYWMIDGLVYWPISLNAVAMRHLQEPPAKIQKCILVPIDCLRHMLQPPTDAVSDLEQRVVGHARRQELLRSRRSDRAYHHWANATPSSGLLWVIAVRAIPVVMRC